MEVARIGGRQRNENARTVARAFRQLLAENRDAGCPSKVRLEWMQRMADDYLADPLAASVGQIGKLIDQYEAIADKESRDLGAAEKAAATLRKQREAVANELLTLCAPLPKSTKRRARG